MNKLKRHLPWIPAFNVVKLEQIDAVVTIRYRGGPNYPIQSADQIEASLSFATDYVDYLIEGMMK